MYDWSFSNIGSPSLYLEIVFVCQILDFYCMEQDCDVVEKMETEEKIEVAKLKCNSRRSKWIK